MRENFDLTSLEQAIGYVFQDKGHVQAALTHPSIKKQPGVQVSDYERLEFVGDRVLGLVIAHLLYKAYPKDSEGVLAKKFASLVRKEMLFTIAQGINLGNYIQTVDRVLSESTLADACEALLAAVYLDGGLAPAFALVERLWGTYLKLSAFTQIQDAKSKLQEWAQKKQLPLPTYALVDKSGSEHDPQFTVKVTLETGSAQATGRTKKIAEQLAAEQLLKDFLHDK